MPTADPNEKNPDYDLVLQEADDAVGTTAVGLVLVNPQTGEHDPLAITRSNYPRQSTRIDTGAGTYDSVNPPYKSIDQDDWSGGRGQEDFEKDETRYFHSYNVDTESSNQVILRGMPRFGMSGIVNNLELMPDDSHTLFSWTTLVVNWYSYKHTNDQGAMTASDVYLYLRKTGTPGTLTCAIYSDSAGEPNASLGTDTVTAANFWSPSDEGVLYRFSPGVALSDATDYHVVIHDDVGADEENYWEVGTWTGTSPGPGHVSSTSGSFWQDTTAQIYNLIVDKQNDPRGRLFEYQRALYYVTQPIDGSASTLYVNGDRGTADSNSGNKSLLNDATKSWTVDEWIGDIALIVSGPGSLDKRPWRVITDSTATSLTVDSAWTTTHTTETEYIIISRKKWTSVQALSDSVVDVAVANAIVFFSYGEGSGDSSVERYLAYTNPSGVWTTELVTDAFKANVLLSITNPDGTFLFASREGHPTLGSGVYIAEVPVVYPEDVESNVFTRRQVLAPTTEAWDDRTVTNVTNSLNNDNQTSIAVAISHTTGIVAHKDLDSAIDVDGAGLVRIGTKIKTSATLTSGQYQFIVSDQPNLGQTRYAPTVVKHLRNYVNPTEAFYYDDDYTADSSKTDYLAITAVIDGNDDTDFTVTMQTADYWYIGHTAVFNSIRTRLGTKNDTASVLSMDCWDGNGWASVTITDGTNVAGDTMKQDGDITFTLPSGWSKGMNPNTADESTSLNANLFWVRLGVSVALDSVDFQDFYVAYTGAKEQVEIQVVDDLPFLLDGRTASNEELSIFTGDYIYIGHSSLQFDEATIDFRDANAVTGVTDTWQYYDGNNWASLADVSDGTDAGSNTPFGQDGSVSWTLPLDWQTTTIGEDEAYYVRVSFDADLTEYMNLNRVDVQRTLQATVDIPGITASQWTWIEGNITIPQSWDAIRSIGLNVATDIGTATILLDGDIWWIEQVPLFKTVGDREQNITNLVAYGQERENPFVFKEGSVFEIQTENNYNVVKLPIDEISAFRSEANGRAATTNDVYLYFNLNHHLERYFNRTLEDIGPNRDSGLPDDRQGIISDLVSAPGKLYAAIEATGSSVLFVGASVTIPNAFSSILVRRGGGWHDMWVAPRDELIHDMQLQVVPGNANRRLWVVVGGKLLWLPLSAVNQNPIYDPNFIYVPEGHYITGWINANYHDIDKMWRSIKLITDNLSGSSPTTTIHVDYQLETGDDSTGWTSIGPVTASSAFATSPSQEAELSSTFNVTGKRIRFRLVLGTQDLTVTPILKATVVEAMLRFPVKDVFTITYRIEDFEHDLLNTKTQARAETKLASIDTWADSVTALTLASNFSVFDGKNVVLEGPGLRPLKIMTQDEIEILVGQSVLLEI